MVMLGLLGSPSASSIGSAPTPIPSNSSSSSPPATALGHVILMSSSTDTVSTASDTLSVAVRTTQHATVRTYTVRSGDTLSVVAQKFYGSGGEWPCLYKVNRPQISNPNTIFVGEILLVPYKLPTSGCQIPSSTTIETTAYVQPTVSETQTTSSTSFGSTLGCAALMTIWKEAGGSSAEAFTAAEIAMAESGGRQYAVSPTDDYGLWQINMAAHGPTQATFNEMGNARAAIAISDDGNNWTPWTTYMSGAYEGRC